MSELPDRPNLDQLRHEARELLRAAAAGELRAVARLRAVSERVTLSAAQLAVARGYGSRSWPALRIEVERRRRLSEQTASLPSPAGEGRGRPDAPEGWRSFGGAAVIDVAAGALFPETLLIGPGHALLHASLTRLGSGGPASRPLPGSPAPPERADSLEDVIVIDDQGVRYDLRVESAQGPSGGPAQLRCLLSPVPGRDVAWLELRGRDGAATRLRPSADPTARIGQLAPVPPGPAERQLTDRALGLIGMRLNLADEAADEILGRYCAAALEKAAELKRSGELDPDSPLPGQLARLCAALTEHRPADGVPAAWSAMLEAAPRIDGPRYHLGLGVDVPPIDDVAVSADSLVSEPDGWRLRLRATPAWWKYSEDRNRKWSAVSVEAGDDRGGRYVSNFGGSGYSPSQGYEEVTLNFLPPLDPSARALKLTFQGASQEVAVDLDLPLTAPSA